MTAGNLLWFGGSVFQLLSIFCAGGSFAYWEVRRRIGWESLVLFGGAWGLSMVAALMWRVA